MEKNLKATLNRLAGELGFSLFGVASLESESVQEVASHYLNWLNEGFAGRMEYLARHLEKKKNPQLSLPDAKSVVCLGLSYPAIDSKEVDPRLPLISNYTRVEDYHEKLGAKISELISRAGLEEGRSAWRFVDSSPVFERFWAARAGLGWVGKHTLLLNRKAGSYFFLGGFFTTARLDADAPGTEHCGKCTRCIDACPTHAIVHHDSRWVVDSRLCIGYNTIENKGPTPEEEMQRQGLWLAGCDICQSVCPWNDPVFEPTPGTWTEENPVAITPLVELARWSSEKFAIETKPFAMGRMKYLGFLKNLAIAVANSNLDASQKQDALESIAANSAENESVLSALNYAFKKQREDLKGI